MPELNKLRIYNHIVKSMGQILALSRLYDQKHPSVEAKASEVFSEITNLITEKEPMVFSESPEATLLVNGEEVKSEGGIMSRFIQDFRKLKLGSLDLKYGITIEEFYVFIELLNSQSKLSGNESIKEYLVKREVVHIEPLFATYKLVSENDVVLKEREVIKVSDIPIEKINSFIQNLYLEKLDKVTLSQDKAYALLSHDSSFLCKVIMDVGRRKNSPDEFIRMLWLIGDYLIDEIDSVKQEGINRKIINELKVGMTSLQENKEFCVEEVNKAFLAITSALQLKGLILLYKKHKKGVDETEKKINHILDELPKESQLYIKAKEEFDKVRVS